MRTLNAELLQALQAGTGKPIATVYIGYMVGNALYSKPAIRYKLTGTTLEAEIALTADLGGDQTAVWIKRGLQVAGTDYTITTGRFYIASQVYQEDGHQIITGTLFPKKKYTAAGDVSYKTAIDAFCTAYNKTAVYRDPAAAWLNYQFLPDGKAITMNDASHFLNLLAQKFLIYCCDNGNEEVLFYSADLLGAVDETIAVKDDFSITLTTLRKRQFIWRDEVGAIHLDGTVTDPLHNLGYLETTATPPARHSPSIEARAIIRPDLRVLDGDVVKLTCLGGVEASFFAEVTEIYEPGASKDPPWRLDLRANPIFHNTEAGAMPSTIERVSNYTPLNTSLFDNVLSASDNNLQAAVDTLDDHTRYKLLADRTYYVRTDGSNSNTGLADTAAGAFLTIQKAIDVAATIDLNGFGVTVQVRSGTHAAFTFKPMVGGNITVVGDPTTPSNVVISSAGDCVTVSGPIMGFVGGLKVTSSAGSGLRAQYLGTLAIIAKCDFGACANFHLYSTDGGFISVQANYDISGGAAVHYYAPTGGEIACPGNTVTILNNPTNFNAAFAYIPNAGKLLAYGQTFTNAAFVTGGRYYADMNSIIFTNGGGANYFPGSVPGAVATGGQYA